MDSPITMSVHGNNNKFFSLFWQQFRLLFFFFLFQQSNSKKILTMLKHLLTFLLFHFLILSCRSEHWFLLHNLWNFFFILLLQWCILKVSSQCYCAINQFNFGTNKIIPSSLQILNCKFTGHKKLLSLSISRNEFISKTLSVHIVHYIFEITFFFSFLSVKVCRRASK